MRDVIAILVTSKYEEDLIKTERARVATTQNNDFFKHSRANNSEVRGRMWSKFELIRDVTNLRMSLLLPRIKKIRIKMKALEWPQH